MLDEQAAGLKEKEDRFREIQKRFRNKRNLYKYMRDKLRLWLPGYRKCSMKFIAYIFFFYVLIREFVCS
jgi:hypothetical protein